MFRVSFEAGVTSVYTLSLSESVSAIWPLLSPYTSSVVLFLLSLEEDIFLLFADSSTVPPFSSGPAGPLDTPFGSSFFAFAAAFSCYFLSLIDLLNFLVPRKLFEKSGGALGAPGLPYIGLASGF